MLHWNLLLWEGHVQLLLEELLLLLLLLVQGWSESIYSFSPAIPHASSCSSLFLLYLLGVFVHAYEKMLQLGTSCRRKKSSHCWSLTQYWPPPMFQTIMIDLLEADSY